MTEAGSNRVIRGGSWNNNAQNCRSANRNRNAPTNRSFNLGFRLMSAKLGRRSAVYGLRSRAEGYVQVIILR